VTDLEHAQALDQYFTRPSLAKAVVEWADIRAGDRILEPSCGGGDLVRWMPTTAKVTAVDIEARPLLVNGHDLELIQSDFLELRRPSDAFDLAVMNPPYGYVGKGKLRRAADRLHVQHALRMAPEVICLVRANFLAGTERYNHVFRFAEVVRMAVLVHRPSFHGPAVEVDGKGGHHEMAVFHLRRREDRMISEQKVDRASVEFWTQDWRLAA
jgi:predicted RNA methylase